MKHLLVVTPASRLPSVGGKLDQIMVEKQPRIIQGGDACFDLASSTGSDNICPLAERMSDSIPDASDWAHRSISVAIISKGRPGVLDDTLESIFRQSQQPQQVIVVVPTVEDVPRKPWGQSVQFIVGPHESSGSIPL